jgi:outer membrane protein OmpA-like peptidoglycan-associated protein
MKLSMKLMSLFAGALTLTCFTSNAKAEDFSLKLQPGLEAPITSPQDMVYNPGAMLNTELLFKLHPNFALGPQVEAAYLPRALNTNENAGVLWQLGLAARLQTDRSANTNGAAWIEGNFSYARTGELNRPALGIRAGLDWFTDDAHTASNGPWMGYQHVIQTSQTDSPTVPLLDHRDYNSFQMGWSFNFDFPTQVRRVAVRHTVHETEYVYVKVPVPSAPQKLSFTERVYFNWDSPVIRNWEESDKIDALVAQMSEHPNMTLNVSGHASPDGNYQHNVQLAIKRTASVVKYLVDHGVDGSRITSESFGPDHPITVSNVQESHERSRRVEFTVVFSTTNNQ